MKNFKFNHILVATFSLGFFACNSSGSQSSGNTGATSTIGGTLSDTTVDSFAPTAKGRLGTPIEKTITHVMAMNPESANPRRFIAEVSNTGAFTLAVDADRPYILVFIDDDSDHNFSGIDKIVGVFKSGDLDSIAPTVDSFGMGTITVNGVSGEATSEFTYDQLISGMGISPSAALVLREVDDISLRYANPDVDQNGVIDMLEDKFFGLDFHIRSISKVGSAMGAVMDAAAIENSYPAASGTGSVFYPDFNLASIYALYSPDFDNTVCASDGLLDNGCAVGWTPNNGFTVDSFSSLNFGEVTGFGPDFNLGVNQMPGSDGTPVLMTFSMSGDNNLHFPSVITRTKTELEASNTLIPFIRLNTVAGTTGAHIESISYKWMKRTNDVEVTWTDATTEEVDLIVNDDGGYAGFYINFLGNTHDRQHHIAFSIPKTTNGTIPFTAASASETDMDETTVGTIVPNDICNTAFSYDDKLGLRIFAGGPTAYPGTLLCP